MSWINAEVQKPKLLEGKDYSENVWATDGKQIYVMSYVYVSEEGWVWANCYGDVFGECEWDDDYEITHWMPINIPKIPSETAGIDNFGHQKEHLTPGAIE